MEAQGTRRRRLIAALCVLAVSCGCGSSADAPAPSPPAGSNTGRADPGGSEGRQLWLPFSEVGQVVVDSALSNDGSVPAVVEIVAEDGGRLGRVSGPDDAGSGIEFPGYDGTSPAPRAVLRVTPAGVDDLAPGENAFEFGADFRIDGRAQGDSKLDNGNNLVQRGLAGDLSQLKIEVDKGRPACRIRGVEGQVDVKLDTVVEPDVWYRIRCRRDGSTVSLTLDRFTEGEPVDVESRRASGAMGELIYPPSLPISVGGKLRSTGSLVTSATDQFNGAVDNVVFGVD